MASPLLAVELVRVDQVDVSSGTDRFGFAPALCVGRPPLETAGFIFGRVRKTRAQKREPTQTIIQPPKKTHLQHKKKKKKKKDQITGRTLGLHLFSTTKIHLEIASDALWNKCKV